MPETPSSPTGRRRGPPSGPIISVAGVVLAATFIYGVAHFRHTARADSPCSATVALAQKVAPLATGEVAAVTMASKPLQMPDLTFRDGNGEEKKLSNWKGKTVLLNLWATWCVPCRKEMPALDRLEGKLGSEKFAVVAVNIDTRDADKPKAFLKDANLTRLGSYNDTKAKVFQDLKSIGLALGMPTSVLVDGQGCEIGHIAGPAEWDSEDALKLINATVAQ